MSRGRFSSELSLSNFSIFLENSYDVLYVLEKSTSLHFFSVGSFLGRGYLYRVFYLLQGGF